MDNTNVKFDGGRVKKGSALRRGWTTGACATAATKAALSALLGRGFPDPVMIKLPGGQTPSFVLMQEFMGEDIARVGIVKDAGDDPDVTHGATIIATLRPGKVGSGVVFHAGKGVGTVTKAGLPLEVGEPAINPVPRKMMRETVMELCAQSGCAPDFSITISVPDGEQIAKKTWNPRLGIIGGISILGTSGIVIPYSCSAWIHSIHSGIDVARAAGLDHVVGCTGDTSEKGARAHLDLAGEAYIDMGDFVGGFMKYLRIHPVQHVTIAGGFAKLSKLSQGAMDLHSARSQVDIGYLCGLLEELGAKPETIEKCQNAGTAKEVLDIARSEKISLADKIARNAAKIAQNLAKSTKISVNILVVDRDGTIVGQSRGNN